MAAERLQFPGALGESLAGRLERPAGPAWATALFAHCFTCSKDLKAVRRITRCLVDEGIAVLSFDFTGLGESAGEFADTNFTSNVEDLLAAAAFLEAEHEAPSVVIGHSLGGAAVLAAAPRLPSVKAVATVGAPSDPAHLADRLEASDPAVAEGEAVVRLAGRPFRLRRQLLDDLRGQRLDEAVRGLRRPLLIFHSPVDEVVGIEHARHLYEAAKHPKSFVSLDGADHLLLRDPADAAFVGRTLAAWLTRYVRRPEPEAWEERQDEAGWVTVRGGASGYAAEVRTGRHRLKADEPAGVGGTDTGPTPYEYLLAGLGACTTMTLRMYADRKAWPLDGVTVRLAHDRVHAKDCADCEAGQRRLDRIRREITLGGTLDAEQRARLMEIADRCPVHRTLEGEIVIETSAVDGGEAS